jgi:hypothetical protein
LIKNNNIIKRSGIWNILCLQIITLSIYFLTPWLPPPAVVIFSPAAPELVALWLVVFPPAAPELVAFWLVGLL